MKFLAPILAIFDKQRIAKFVGGAPSQPLEVQKCIGFGRCSSQMLNDLSHSLSSRYQSLFNAVPSSNASSKVCETRTLFETLRAGASDLGVEAKTILASAASAAVLHRGKIGVAVAAVALALAVPKIRAYLMSRHECLKPNGVEITGNPPRDTNSMRKPLAPEELSQKRIQDVETSAKGTNDDDLAFLAVMSFLYPEYNIRSFKDLNNLGISHRGHHHTKSNRHMNRPRGL